MKLHHYTSIENLALILKNRTIRFSRLDRVDDIEEASMYEQTVPMGKYTFVSCWTNSDEESIPLWKMYTPQMKGVRITMDSDMFLMKKIQTGTYQTPIGTLNIEGELESLFSPEEQFNEQYGILFQGRNDPNFFRAIEYVDTCVDSGKEAIQFELINGEYKLNVDTSKVGKYKNKRWAFQEEVRFALTIVPMQINPITHHFEIIQAMQHGIDLSMMYYDLKLSEEALGRMEITMSPCCNDADKIIIESLVDTLNPTATILSSRLFGYIRK
ncbi:hypothetical protein H8784_02345 [Parabacteroides acidifaciens]|uniref:DUF2971 domain-containing protein n=1 Tax=Parabacteroides acidifaciens TaxID=2290935 RepID=A0A3D8HIN8_9BACT|nr:hypothetical protein [Parabacteroides acidifaciens]MBC8600555.1 hypothetical protein [Parabacteroides acidifaciens]RDU50846.1 hypothetical protein DWU89_02385 [Parabacteroides acidifaciens]